MLSLCIVPMYRLEFPSVLIIYQDIIMSIHGIFTLIGFGDRSLLCSSEDLVESYNNPPSPFCTASGEGLLQTSRQDL